VKVLRSMTEGRGPDVCIDAVGMEAHRSLWKKLANVVHAQVGSTDVLETCFSAVRRGGMVSVVGVYGMSYDNFPIGQFFDKELRMWAGQALVHKHIDELMELVRTGKLQTDDIITHRLPLAEAPAAYELFQKKEDGAFKVVFRP